MDKWIYIHRTKEDDNYLLNVWTKTEFLVIVSTGDCHMHGIPHKLHGISMVWKTWIKKKITLSIQTG